MLAANPDELPYRTFKAAWFRIVRQAVLGPDAADDEAFTRRLEALRGNANWSFLKRPDRAKRDRFLADLRQRLKAARDDSLGALALRHSAPGDVPGDQVAQWLFAFDAAGIASFRALALLATHPEFEARAHAEASSGDPLRPFLRAALLDTIRLWPTTPLILRETDSDVLLGGAAIPAGTTLLIHLPFLHRDESRIPYAHRFVPDVWLDGRAEAWPFVPFSGGPAQCPARNLVLLLATAFLASLLRGHRFGLPASHPLVASKLPMTFDQFHLALRIADRKTGARTERSAAQPVER